MDARQRIVVSFGDDGLADFGSDPVVRREHVRAAAREVAPLADRNGLVLCFGTDAQLISAQCSVPLDVLHAQAQALIGYWFVQELHNAGVSRPVAALVAQTIVRFTDPGLGPVNRQIGPAYDAESAVRLSAEFGWRLAEGAGEWRRVLPCLAPLRIAELATIRAMLARGVVVVCGLGVAVTEDETGRRLPASAVFDADCAAVQLASDVGADRVVLLSGHSRTTISRTDRTWLDTESGLTARRHAIAVPACGAVNPC